jgi:single-strand DNA-binding protein
MVDNTVTLVGTITRDLELRHTPNGAAVVDIGIAQNKSVRQPDGTWTRDGDPMYFECTVWRDMAEHANATLGKGMRVIVTGKLDYQTWENNDGEVRNKIKVLVDEIGPSLRWATANVERTSGGSSGDTAPSPSTENLSDNEAPF